MICQIWVRSFAYTLDISHFRCSWPVIYFARTFLVSNEMKFKKRRILQEDESRPVERKTTFDARVPFHRSSHEWSRAVYPGVQVTLCICGERRGPNSPPVSAFRGEPMIYIIDSSSNSTNSRLGRPCLCVLWHAVLPINRVIVFVLAEFRCSGWKTRVPKAEAFCGLHVQLNLCGIENGGLQCREKSRRKRKSRKSI